jgi:hypothetical protein
MNRTRVCIVAGVLALAAHSAQAAEPPRTTDLEIRANGRLVLRGELIDRTDDLEARLRVMREAEPPLDFGLKVPKTFAFDTIAAIAQIVQSMGMSLGFIGNFGAPAETPRPAPVGTVVPDDSTI